MRIFGWVQGGPSNSEEEPTRRICGPSCGRGQCAARRAWPGRVKPGVAGALPSHPRKPAGREGCRGGGTTQPTAVTQAVCLASHVARGRFSRRYPARAARRLQRPYDGLGD